MTATSSSGNVPDMGLVLGGQMPDIDVHRLPYEGSDDSRLAHMGVMIDRRDPDDPLFVFATLPRGWWIDERYLYVYDERDIPRIALMTRGRFFDRSAYMIVLHVGKHYAESFIYGVRQYDTVTPFDKMTAAEIQEYISRLRLFVHEADDYGASAEQVAKVRRALEPYWDDPEGDPV